MANIDKPDPLDRPLGMFLYIVAIVAGLGVGLALFVLALGGVAILLGAVR